MPFRRRYRRRRFRRSSRRSSRYRSPWSSLRRVRRRRARPSLTRRAVLSNRRAIQTIRSEIEVKRSSDAAYPDSSGAIEPVSTLGRANGSSGINSGTTAIVIDGAGHQLSDQGNLINTPFCPGLVITRPGVANFNQSGDYTHLNGGGRLGRWITMKTLAVKCQLKLKRDCPVNATVKVHLFLVLDLMPTNTFNAVANVTDVAFDMRDKKVSRFNGGALVDNPQQMMYTLPRDVAVQKRFRVLQKRTVYLSRGAAPAIPMDTNGLPPYQRCTPPGPAPPSLATGSVPGDTQGNVSIMPLHGQGRSSAPYVKYVTMYLKAGYKFDFGDSTPGSNDFSLPINQQIRFLAYTENTGVALTDDCTIGADSIPVELVYSGNFRYTDA